MSTKEPLLPHIIKWTAETLLSLKSMSHDCSHSEWGSALLNPSSIRCSFAELPETHQKALIHYMSVDGAAWAVEDEWDDWKWGEGKGYDPETRQRQLDDIDKYLPRFVKEYGNQMFGYCSITHNDMRGILERFSARTGVDILWSGSAPDVAYDTPTWPVIICFLQNELIEDGWNRLRQYLAKDMDVPLIWYAD